MFNKLMGGPGEAQDAATPAAPQVSAAKPQAPASGTGTSNASPAGGATLKRMAPSTTSTATGASVAVSRTLVGANAAAPSSVTHASRSPAAADCLTGLDGDDVSKILIDLPIKYGNFAKDFLNNGVKLDSAIKLALTLYKRDLGKTGIFESLEIDGNQEKKTDNRDVVYSTIIEAAEQIINSIATRHCKESGLGTQQPIGAMASVLASSSSSSSGHMGSITANANGHHPDVYDVFSQTFTGTPQPPSSGSPYYGGGHMVASSLTFGDDTHQHGYPTDDELGT